VLACALAVELADLTVFSIRQISLVGGVVLSLQLAVIVVLLLAHRQFRALAAAPTYLLFRLFRKYVALETLLTLRLRTSPARPPLSVPRMGMDRPNELSEGGGDDEAHGDPGLIGCGSGSCRQPSGV
jgi:hypothetical protein